MSQSQVISNPDVLLVGSGIMSANLATLLKRLDPTLRIQVYELTDGLSEEASNGWNNAGTGHAGLCELSYTPFKDAQGHVIIDKAISVYEQFEQSLQYWGYAVASGMMHSTREFINPVPHLSFVHGDVEVPLLNDRYQAMSRHHFFSDMEFTKDRTTIAQWAPLLVDGREEMPVAATRISQGTDVNFGEISRRLLGWLGQQEGCGIATSHKVTNLQRKGDAWEATVSNLQTGEIHHTLAKFVFVGAGGGSLNLLQKSRIPESRGLGGFPIGGQWLICTNPDIIAQHQAKVYGQALPTAPTMAVPHLDSRILDGNKCLLFGPFAAWTTKFLHKRGSHFDLPGSIKLNNLATLLRIGVSNIDLVRYLMREGTQSMADRMKILHVFYPAAKASDWKLIDAGIRVQAIKKTDGLAGIVHYGTEVISNRDHTIAALLGASPGASTSVNIVLDVIKRCFGDMIARPEVTARLKEMIPSWDVDIKLPEHADFYREHHHRAMERLNLQA